MSDQEINSEKEKEEYQNLVTESCQHLLPLLTHFTTFESAPKHTLYHLNLIVDAALKSVPKGYRVSGFFHKTERKFNLERIESKLFLKDINAEQTSRLKDLFNKFIGYVTQKLNWKFSSDTEISVHLILPKILPVVREKQMFNFGFEKHYQQIISEHLKKLRNLSSVQLIGLLALSSMFDSKKLHAQFILSIINAEVDNLVWLTDKDCLLKINHGELEAQSFRLHWITIVILMEKFRRTTEKNCVFKTEKKGLEEAVRLICQEYLKSQPAAISKLALPIQLSKIIEIASTDYFMHRPAFFHAAMTGNLPQTPLAVATKLRVLSGKAVQRTKQRKLLEENPRSKILPEFVKKLGQHEEWLEDEAIQSSIAPLNWQLKTIKNLIKDIAGVSKLEVLRTLQRILDDQPSNFSLMSLWLIAWLKNLYEGEGSREVIRNAKKSLKKNSILRYFGTVYRHILPVFDNIDVAELEDDEWIELLQECLDNSTDTQLYQPLSRFVRFLVAEFNIPVLPLRDLEGGDGFSNVNANFITPFEVSTILSTLIKPENHMISSSNRMKACALILGFFCGLRRKEVLGLRVSDIYGHKDRPFLFVRPHRYRGLKNSYSRRRMNLVDFIPEPYLQVLMDWHSHQTALGMNFLLSFNQREIGDDATIIEPVQSYCRQITGDETFVFHALRHSFANIYLIRIFQISKPKCSRWLGRMNQELIEFYSINQSQIFIKKYFPSENKRLPRSSLLQLAELLGHKVPNTTCRSYLHLIDEIETEYFSSVNKEVKESWIDQYWLFKKPYQRTRFKKSLLNQDKEIDEIVLIKKIYTDVLKKDLSHGYENAIFSQPNIIINLKKDNESETWPPHELVANIYPIYKQLFVQKTLAEDIAAAFSLPRDAIQQVQGNAAFISKIKTSKGKPRFKKPFLLRRSIELDKKLNKLMSKLSKIEIDQNEIMPGLTLYLQSSQAKNAYRVMLKNNQQAIDYIRLLRAIKLPATNMGIRIYPSNCHDKTEDELKQYWENIFAQGFEKQVKPNSVKILSSITTKSEYGQIEVEPIKIHDQKTELLEHHLYAIYLLCILYGDKHMIESATSKKTPAR